MGAGQVIRSSNVSRIDKYSLKFILFGKCQRSGNFPMARSATAKPKGHLYTVILVLGMAVAVLMSSGPASALTEIECRAITDVELAAE